jgi:RHS repeat-associated protein
MTKTPLNTLLTLFLISCAALFSVEVKEEPEPLIETVSPEQISDLIENNDLLIGGLVNPLSGNLCMRNYDLVAKGAQDIVLSRTFIASYMPKQFDDDGAYDQYYLYDYTRTMKGWVFFPHSKLKLRTIDEKTVILLTLPNGISLDYIVSGKGDNSTTSLLDSSALGIGNFSQELPSGAHDLRNVQIYGIEKWNKIVVKTPDGKTYHYKTASMQKEPVIYFLEKEIFPNGKILRYTFDKSQDATNKIRVMRIESCDPLERFVYASMDVHYDPITRGYHFATNSGQEANYNYEIRKQFQHSKKSKKEINYSTQSSPFLSEVNSPFYRKERIQYNPRFLLDKYFGRNNPFSCTYDIFHSEDKEHYRVKTISKPVGIDDVDEMLYDINYQVVIPKKRGGKTSVKHADETKTVYSYSSHLLINEIQYFDAKGRLKKAKSFAWDQKHWLSSLTVSDGQGNIFCKKSYAYDNFGNPILETIFGNITGEGNVETTIKRKFSEDGRNLLLKEEREGEAIYYRYLPNTNLKTAVYTKANKKIFRRIFYVYDDSNNLTRKIEDDGFTPDRNNLEGVSVRKITKYVLRLEQPFVHMPEWIIESYVDHDQEKLLQKKKLSYNSLGYVSQEDIYDAEGEFAYSVYKEYNERGDIISETNAMGQKARYEYDDSGNRLLATSFSQKTFETMQYDSTGRLRNKTEGDAQINLSKTFDYDKNNHLVQETDGYDNATLYQYDHFANKVSQEIRPSTVSLGGTQEVKLSARYDSFGRVIAKTDANGNTTEYKYNIYDSPTEITYPNGSKELYRYDRRGRLLSYVDREGEETSYTYDPLGRIASKTFSSLTEYFKYNRFNLLNKTDREGHTTHYLYDGAGRLIQERFCDKVTDFAYDALGQKSRTIKHNQDNTLITSYKRDFLDRLVKETESSWSGNILYQIYYAYDEEGNRNKITRFVNNQPAKETFVYDPLKRLIEHHDALDNVTTTQYNDFFMNSLGQRVLSKTIIDPEGMHTIEEYDPFGKIVKREVVDKDKPVSILKNWYDAHGNLVEHQDQLSQKTQISHYTYNTLNLVESHTRAYSTSHARTTQYAYTPAGRIVSKQLPDQTILSYTYTPTGKLKSLTSSDNQIDHRFTYNHCDVLTKAHDEINKITVDREVDAYGNTTKETFSTGIEVKKSYDLLDRRISLDLGVFGKVLYQYDPSYLREVTRVRDASVQTHRYVQYDLAGNLLAENQINDLDTVHYRYDALGRQAAINSLYFNEEYVYSPKGNLVSRSHAQRSVDYTYDPLSQLTSESSNTSQTYTYDALHNRLSKNGELCFSNDLNELIVQDEIICTYDLNGNLVKKTSPETNLQLTYDSLNRLVQADKNNQIIKFSYDPLGRRLTKSISEANRILLQENYLYDGMEEIGAVAADGKLKQFRVLGLAYENRTFDSVALELDDHTFAAILDRQNNIRVLVDSETKKADNNADFTAFGEVVTEKVSLFNPWRYASKRNDYELGLINFGKRYYDPEIARWLSPDPAGFRDSHNLYQFLLNNPHAYCDPHGEFVFALVGFAFGVGAPVMTYSIGQIAMGAALIATAAWGGTKAYHLLNDIHAQHLINQAIAANEELLSDGKPKKIKGTREKAPYCPGIDPTVSPAEGFEWRGRGDPGSKGGGWHKPTTGESLRPDLHHPLPIGPHWDYQDNYDNKRRIDENGIIEWK